MTVYDNIKFIAEERNLPISTIESQSGIANGVIKGWDSSFPRADKLLQVAEFLEVSMEELMLGRDYKGILLPFGNNEPEVDLDPMEKIILENYRKLDALGKTRVIQTCLNEADRYKQESRAAVS